MTKRVREFEDDPCVFWSGIQTKWADTISEYIMANSLDNFKMSIRIAGDVCMSQNMEPQFTFNKYTKCREVVEEKTVACYLKVSTVIPATLWKQLEHGINQFYVDLEKLINLRCDLECKHAERKIGDTKLSCGCDNDAWVSLGSSIICRLIKKK